MIIQLNFHSGKSAYFQIMEQIKLAAATGELHPGDALPSIRELAEQLRVNRNTVSKAYGLLQSEGIVSSEPGRGVYLRAGISPFRREVRLSMMGNLIDAVIVQARQFQMSGDEVRELLEERIQFFRLDRDRREQGTRNAE